MPSPTSCPSTERLETLLTGEADSADQATLIAHLDSCALCQQTIEQLAHADPFLLSAASALLRNTYVEEQPLRRVLNELSADATATLLVPPPDRSSWIRSFLKPAAALESLGQLGQFEVTELLGQGSMGVVLKAREPALKRPVAIKMLAPDLASDKVARERFAREAQAAAAVRHEQVVTIHAVSEANGLPFLVMEYVDGGSLQDYLDRHGPPEWHEAARLAAEIASGLAAAHAQGLVHRDIKPSNILLRRDDADHGPGSAKIGDFGLARVADESRLTQTGVVAGTPMYMAPEQAEGKAVDSRADLFSLGSVLYALLTGRDPFPAGSPLAVLRQVCDAKPRPIREFNSAVPNWLVAIVDRLHAKRPGDRFASAEEVETLLRYNLKHPNEPRVVAPPPRRQARPFRKASLFLALGTAGILIAFGLLLGEAWRRQGLRTDVQADGSSGATKDEQLPLLATLEGHKGLIWSAAIAPNGKVIATGSDDDTLRLWDAANGKELAQLGQHPTAVNAVAFAHSGKFLVSADGDGTLHMWNASDWKESVKFPPRLGIGRRLALSPDDKWLAVPNGVQGVEIWDLGELKIGRTLPGQHASIAALAFANDNKTLVTGDTSGQIQFWDTSTGDNLNMTVRDGFRLSALIFTPDGKNLISAGSNKEVSVWKIGNGKCERVTTLPGYEHGVQTLAMSPDGRLLATGGSDGLVKIWDFRAESVIATFVAHQERVLSMSFSPNNRTLITVGDDRIGKIWDITELKTSSR